MTTTVGVYTYDAFAREGRCNGLGQWPLWYARYIPGATWASILRLVPPPWTADSLVLWQSGQTRIAGIGAGDGPGVDTDQTPDLELLMGDDMTPEDLFNAVLDDNPQTNKLAQAFLAKLSTIWTQLIGAGDSEVTAAVLQQRAGSLSPAAIAAAVTTAVTAAIDAHAGTTGTPLPDDFAKTVADSVAADLATRLAN